jgi:hypothetical protein
MSVLRDRFDFLDGSTQPCRPSEHKESLVI